MEGKYTKVATIVGVLSLLIILWQVFQPKEHKLSGEWEMTSTVMEADMQKYVGAKIKWRLFMTEDFNTLKGTGEKVSINEKDLDYNQRTTIEFQGIIKSGIFILNFTENGLKRKTTGIIKARFKNDTFVGEFSQTASNSKGQIEGKKLD